MLITWLQMAQHLTDANLSAACWSVSGFLTTTINGNK